MKPGHIAVAAAAVVLFCIVFFVAKATSGGAADGLAAAPAPVLAVAQVRAEVATLPIRVPATGHVAAWQEASVGAEADGLRLVEVNVNVGDVVKHGQALARFSDDVVDAELAEAQASVAQAAAEAGEADANAQRATSLGRSGALSAQQIDRYLAAAATARARLDAVRAAERKHRLRHGQTRVLAPDDGVITSRTATVGAVVPAGQELFRLIRDGRLEWRAAVAAADLDSLAPGQAATVVVQGRPIHGTLRMIAPAIDTSTHSGLVYVDLPPDPVLRAGVFARGHVEVGDAPALTVPQSAVSLRDGFPHVMLVGPGSTVVLRPVDVGRRIGERVEIVSGLATSEPVIAAGLGFLSEGDVVRVVDAAAPPDATLAGSAP